MPDYRKMYFQLAARVADAVELLIDAQREGEEGFLEEEPEDFPEEIKKSGNKKDR